MEVHYSNSSEIFIQFKIGGSGCEGNFRKPKLNFKSQSGKIPLVLKKPPGVDTRTHSYKQNSGVEVNSTLEMANQINHGTNFSFSEWSIAA